MTDDLSDVDALLTEYSAPQPKPKAVTGEKSETPDEREKRIKRETEAAIEQAAQQYEGVVLDPHLRTIATFYKTEFRQKIRQNRQSVPTGFKNFDDYNRGGLHNGLYCITAGTSVGKTDFCLQMADQMAAAGTDVLYFSLEMTRESLLSRSLSRCHAAAHIDAYPFGDPKTKDNHKIDDGAFLRGEISDPETEQLYINGAGSHLRISEGIMCTTVLDVVATVFHYAVKSGRAEKHGNDYVKTDRDCPPFVVFVDYFQDLQPHDDGKYRTDRQIASAAVQALYKLSKELCIPVVVISATARSGYREEQTIASAKESGMIEYAADAVFGLQYHVVSTAKYRAAGDTPKQNNPEKTKADLYREAQRQYPRQMELTLQKNRFTGDDPVSFSFSYCPNIHTYRDEGLNHWKDSDSSSEANTQTNAAAAFGKQNGAEKNSSKYRSGRAH